MGMRVLNTPYITHLRPPTDPRYPISTLEVLRFEVSWYCCVYPVEIQMLPSDVMGNNLPLSSFFCDEVGPSQPLDRTPVVSAPTQTVNRSTGGWRSTSIAEGWLEELIKAFPGLSKEGSRSRLTKPPPRQLACAHRSVVYSAAASFRMGMSGSASFQRVRKSW